LRRLPVVNRRCRNDTTWCDRSEVRRADYPNGNKAPYRLWREAFDAHMEKANWMRDVVADDPI
jgi:hypothetical protein